MEEDPRFAHVLNDPKFQRIPKSQRKVKIDKRFKSMFKDERFKIKYTVDKRGRPVNHTSDADLKRYYELSSESSSSEPEEDGEEDNRLDVEDKSDTNVPDKIRNKLQNLDVDYARGECDLLSESSSDEDDANDTGNSEEDDEGLEHAWGELDKDADRTEEVTCRLAACNMDWDRIRAVDLMVLLNSFLPSGGLIRSVTIYPSDFGLQRMKEEEINGPSELVDTKLEDESQNTEGSKYHMEKLRQYQLNRLKYYYAVIECDDKATANKIYTECDGLEYESSATKMDLRFIPNNMEFENDPKEICDKLPEPGKYQPRFFTTTALQQAKVNLTWDETNPERVELAQKLASGKGDEINQGDLEAYLASSSDEDDLAEQSQVDDVCNAEGKDTAVSNPIQKYKDLLFAIENSEKEKNEKDIEMEVTWGIDLKGKAEKLVHKKINEQLEKTPFQEFLDKRKEKKKEKRKTKKQELNEESNNESDEIPSDIDLNDPYFAEEFDKPEFKKSKNKKIKSLEDPLAEKQNEAELELLLMNTEDNKKHFSLDKLQQKEKTTNKKKKQKGHKDGLQETKGDVDDFEMNVADERFSALYSSHHYNLDPTDPHYKKTKGTEAIVQEKLKRRTTDIEEPYGKKIKSTKRDAELNVLLKSVKRKTEALNKKKKQL